MTNLHLFELINASPGIAPLRLALATAAARWLIYVVAAVLALGWMRGDRAARRELLRMSVAVLMAWAIAQLIAHAWPQPRPFALHLGTQYLAHANDPGLPSDHATVLWSLAFSALGTRRFAVWCFPLLALGLVVGLSRVYLGAHFPFDIAAALPVAIAGALLERALRRPLRPIGERILQHHDRLALAVRARLHWPRKA